MKEVDELEEFLNKAHGEITITVDGMVPHISGTINNIGMMMAAFACMKSLEVKTGHGFDETVERMKDLNDVMEYHIQGKIDGEKYD